MTYLKFLNCILLLCYIYLLYYIYLKINKDRNEKFTNFLETLSKLVDNKDETIKLNKYKIVNEEEKIIPIKYIYLSNLSSDNDKFLKYYLYDKNNNFYMKVVGKLNDYHKNIEIKNIKNSVIGNLISEKYTTLKFKLNFYNNKIINIEYKNNYQSVKLYLEEDDKEFYIIFKKNKYYIYLFNNLEIGLVKKDINKNIYKIIVYEDYKLYLNFIGLGLIILLNN